MKALRSLPLWIALTAPILMDHKKVNPQSLQNQWQNPSSKCTKKRATWHYKDGDGRKSDYYCVSNGVVINGEGEFEGKIGVTTKSRFRGMINAWAFENGSLVRYECYNIPFQFQCRDRVRRDKMKRIRY